MVDQEMMRNIMKHLNNLEPLAILGILLLAAPMIVTVLMGIVLVLLPSDLHGGVPFWRVLVQRFLS